MAFRLLPEYKHLFEGIELADSITWDPHKQFGVPIPNSMLFVRRGDDFNRMAIYGSYFNRKEDPEPNPGLKSPPSTRPCSAMPLVTSIRYQGMKKVKERLRVSITAIKRLAEKLEQDDDIEVFNKPDTGILCFRIKPEGFPENRLDRLQEYIFKTIQNEGKRSIAVTRLNKKTVLRVVAVSPSVTYEALMETIRYIRILAREYIED
jgi:aromatic-L-amino-acid decarboxylase